MSSSFRNSVYPDGYYLSLKQYSYTLMWVEWLKRWFFFPKKEAISHCSSSSHRGFSLCVSHDKLLSVSIFMTHVNAMTEVITLFFPNPSNALEIALIFWENMSVFLWLIQFKVLMAQNFFGNKGSEPFPNTLWMAHNFLDLICWRVDKEHWHYLCTAIFSAAKQNDHLHEWCLVQGMA